MDKNFWLYWVGYVKDNAGQNGPCQIAAGAALGRVAVAIPGVENAFLRVLLEMSGMPVLLSVVHENDIGQEWSKWEELIAAMERDASSHAEFKGIETLLELATMLGKLSLVRKIALERYETRAMAGDATATRRLYVFAVLATDGDDLIRRFTRESGKDVCDESPRPAEEVFGPEDAAAFGLAGTVVSAVETVYLDRLVYRRPTA